MCVCVYTFSYLLRLGYIIVRFKAMNPGYWPFHCHAMMHNLEGMFILVQITDPKHPERPTPPEGLPHCSSYEASRDVLPWTADGTNDLFFELFCFLV